VSRSGPLLVAAALLLAGCSTATTTVPSPEPVAEVPAETRAEAPVEVEVEQPPPPSPEPASWVVGTVPLPLRADGFGEVQPTPDQLRDRRLHTTDLLPPPPDDRFAATVQPVSADVRDRMGQTWSPACPVALGDLRHLTLSFRGFDGQAHTGELVVAATVADDVVEVFRALYDEGFPIEQMRLPTTADLTAAPTGDGNNTAAYVCRAARGQSRWSAHAYGVAVDINPFQNPYERGDLVLPELASAYLDRTWARPGMHAADGPAVRAFTAAGWTWGGSWRTTQDPMHFSLTGD
jgi:hypothetical protein